MRIVAALLLGLSFFACTSKQAATSAPASAPATSQAASAPGPGEDVYRFDGSCDSAQPLGELEKYPLQLRTKENSLNKVRVRSTGRFVAGDVSNVLGELPVGVVLLGQGPISNPEYGKSKAYAVALEDSGGKRCRGFVSTQVVELVGRAPWAGKSGSAPSTPPASQASSQGTP